MKLKLLAIFLISFQLFAQEFCDSGRVAKCHAVDVHANQNFSVQCGTLKDAGDEQARYCISTPKSGFNGKVLYYFHGKCQCEKTWFETTYYSEQIQQQWMIEKSQAPTVISLSWGLLWMLNTDGAGAPMGVDFVRLNHAMNVLEAKLPGDVVKRNLLGVSMGGFNALQSAFHLGRFDSIAPLCAMLFEISPFDSNEVINQFIAAKPHRDAKTIWETVQLARFVFPSSEQWEQGDHLQLITKANKLPPLYLAAGMTDLYGVYEGHQSFARLAQEHGHKVDWRPQWGGHCAIDIPSLVRFLE